MNNVFCPGQRSGAQLGDPRTPVRDNQQKRDLPGGSRGLPRRHLSREPLQDADSPPAVGGGDDGRHSSLGCHVGVRTVAVEDIEMEFLGTSNKLRRCRLTGIVDSTPRRTNESKIPVDERSPVQAGNSLLRRQVCQAKVGCRPCRRSACRALSRDCRYAGES